MKKILSIGLILLLGAMTYIMAVPAYPYPRTITQPDGSKLTIVQRGDENSHYTMTEDGILIVENEAGIYEYATISDNQIRKTGVKATDKSRRSVSDVNFITTLNTDLTQLATSVDRPLKMKSVNGPAKATRSTSATRSLVILVNFSNKSFTISNPQQAFTNLLNQKGYSTNNGTGSARDFYIACSDSAYQPTFDVVGPYTLPNSMSYYGSNDSYGDDSNPQQMISDACELANADVNFADYDTDGDGYVDNVFVYYAGYNEAEGASSSTIWPHRWVVYPTVTFDGKKIYDYACTSELTGTYGSTMCGIGTFCHEFGHVLGLPDLYITDYGSSHTTLEEWSVMDYGAYLNSGRTPCTFSAYERFFLGWTTPTILNQPASEQFGSLLSTNKTYLISQSGTHNLDGENPNPVQFFLLENRQQTGWDTYLPGHGMLITRIYYSSSDWYNNTVNNTSSAMGVDLMEADGSTSSYNRDGDPFPGTDNVTSYTPKLRNGTLLSTMPITNITESNGIISFDFMGGATTQLRTSGTVNSFSTVDGIATSGQELALSGYGLVDSVSVYFAVGTHFEVLNPATNTWVHSFKLPNTQGNISSNIDVRYHPQNIGSHTDRLYFSSTDAQTIYIDVQGSCRDTGISDSDANNAIYLLTTPQTWYIVCKQESSNYKIKLYNIGGQLVMSDTMTGDYTIDKEQLGRGVYIVEIVNENGSQEFVQKIIY